MKALTLRSNGLPSAVADEALVINKNFGINKNGISSSVRKQYE